VTSITLLIPSQTLGWPLSILGSLDHRPVLVYSLDTSDQGHSPKRTYAISMRQILSYNVHPVVAMATNLPLPLPPFTSCFGPFLTYHMG
jgi:hypothetical protein